MTRRVLMCFLGALVLSAGLIAKPDQPAAQGGEIVLLNGQHWTQLPADAKLAFVSGVVQVVEFERNLNGEQWPEKSFLPHFANGLKGKTLNDVVILIDTYYASNPTRVGDPVMKAFVQTVVLPAE